MPPLPDVIIAVLAPFAGLFSAAVWGHSRVVDLRAAPGGVDQPVAVDSTFIPVESNKVTLYFALTPSSPWVAAMRTNPLETPAKPILYPDSDGKPMADNTKQFRWIVTLVGGLEALFAADPNVFVAGDLLWYPVEGDNRIRIAPDALVAFGRPKGDRGSYKQWEEAGIAPQVVFEVLSPGNTRKEMTDKLAFYDHYGVEEYYLYDPDNGRLQGWRWQGGRLVEIVRMRGWISPRLGVRFELDGMDLCLTTPDGRRFASYVEVARRAEAAEAELARLRALLQQQGIDLSS